MLLNSYQFNCGVCVCVCMMDRDDKMIITVIHLLSPAVTLTIPTLVQALIASVLSIY